MVDSDSTAASITALLQGGRIDAQGLLPLVYDELRQLARARIARMAKGHTMRATELVHEAWMRLAAQTRLTINDRTHFLALASGAMRRVLVDHARRRLADKRVAPPPVESLDLTHASPEEWAVTVIAVHDALARLQQVDERLYKVVECRFFGGLTEEETAEVLQVSPRTIHRDWLKARGWLLMALRD